MKRIVHAGIVAASMLASAASMAAPCGGFTDVDDAQYTEDFCAGPAWMRNRSVTLGCGLNTYCPTQNVNRIQMAAFMKRLGDALTTKKLFVDVNPGFVQLQNQGKTFVCRTAPYTPAFQQSAMAHGLAWGLVDAAVGWSADLWYSVDGGTNFDYMTNYIPSFNATTPGMTSGSTFGQLVLNPGTSYVFAILIREAIDAPAGTGNFVDLACHLSVEIGNHAPSAVTPPPCDGPGVGCGDGTHAAGAGGRQAAGADGGTAGSPIPVGALRRNRPF